MDSGEIGPQKEAELGLSGPDVGGGSNGCVRDFGDVKARHLFLHLSPELFAEARKLRQPAQSQA